MKKILLPFAIMGAILSSCGGGESAQKEEAPKMQLGAEEEESAEEVEPIIELTIEANDQMKYNLDKLVVTAGQTVRLTLNHIGTMPVEAMGHNWVLLAQGVEPSDFAAAAMDDKDNDYIPTEAEWADKVIAHTTTIGGGAETTIEFEAPAKGSYDFICSFPGHFGMMNGKFIVK